ncbi:MAG: helix-turn-helix transcriptional regulator [Deltaproteobacteria bacterium]|nr:helix-turn-helix transcriptional regulator [Deltaproteobacteria bacterium]
MADLSRNAAQSTNSTAELGQLLRAYRKSRNMSQVEAAALAGVGERFLSELERGKSTAEIGKVFNVLNRFGLTLTIARRGGRPLFDDEALSDELNEPLEALS